MSKSILNTTQRAQHGTSRYDKRVRHSLGHKGNKPKHVHPDRKPMMDSHPGVPMSEIFDTNKHAPANALTKRRAKMGDPWPWR